jgi:type I restriction enzyme S subunit
MLATASPAELAKFRLRRGDVLITKDSEEWDDIAVASFVTQDFDDVACGYHLAQVRADEDIMEPEYLFRAFQASGVSEQFHVAANGVTRFGIAAGAIGAVEFPVPPMEEQRAIAAFLARETSRIDALVAKKRQLIAQLQDKRRALVDEVFSSDRHPGWRRERLKFSTSFVTSGSRGWAEFYSDDGAVFIRIGNLSRDSIDLDLSDIRRVTPPAGTEGERTRARAGDVLVSVTAYVGSVGVVPVGLDEAYVNQHTALVRLRADTLAPRWLAYCLFSCFGQEQFERSLYGGTKDGLSLEDVQNLLIVKPPQHEQKAVVASLDTSTSQLARVASTVEGAVERLREYRSALITAAVTGAIDVRNLPEGTSCQ